MQTDTTASKIAATYKITFNFDLDFIILACNTLSSVIDYRVMLKYKMPILKTVPKKS